QETVKTLALRVRQKGLDLVCHITPETPDALVGDPGRLRQIIVNLVGNAIKFTNQGEVALGVAVDAAGPNDVLLHFSVTDNGIGIAADKQQLIFEAFSQADGSTTRRYGGTGLGLAISSKFVRMMGGRIWVESQLGVGSTFHFTARFARQQIEQVPAHSPIPDPAWRNLRVLVVDDNGTNRAILQESLAQWHMKPTAVS